MKRTAGYCGLSAIVVRGAVVLLASLVMAGGQAQEPAKKKPAPQAAPAAAAPAAQPPQAPQLAMPEAERIVLLVRTSLLTLNDALQTGNFTVLRDVSAPDFARANSAARLSTIFGNLTKQGIDLTAVAIIMPQLAEAPVIDQKSRMLLIKGFFPGQPVRLDFEVLYQAVDGRWRLFGLSVRPTNATPVAVANPSPVAPKALEAPGKWKTEQTGAAPAKK